MPSKYIYAKYEPEILDAVFVRQKKILNDKNLSDEEKEKKAPFFILLDDVISDQRLRYDANLTNHAYWYTSLIWQLEELRLGDFRPPRPVHFPYLPPPRHTQLENK